MKNKRLMLRIDDAVDGFIKKRMSKTMTDSEKLRFLITVGMEFFDVIDELKKQLKIVSTVR